MNAEDICEKLQSNERRPKIVALENLQNYCDNRETPETEIITTFDECYLHLLKCYSDRYESVRNQAAQTLTHFIERLPPNDFHLLNIVATLAQRLGQQDTVEESEEIRLLYVTQLHLLVRHYVTTGNVRSLYECCVDIVRVLAKTLRDPYPAVQREACDCIVTLSIAIDSFVFQPHVEQLVTPLYGMLNHKHSQARIAAIKALSRLALHINASGEALSRLLMEVSPLLMDSMPLVRRECGQLGVLLLLELRDRYSYFERIIPLVLCCLKDDSPEVVDYIRPFWLQCGKLYFDENEVELRKQELADLPAPNYPDCVQRPTIGCRGLVQRALRLLSLITRETSDWKENVRMHSLKLLYQFVLHAEAAMTAKFFEIYPDVARACCDSESTVANEALKVADLMGRLLCYSDWWEHGFSGLEKNPKEGYLKCFYFMFTAAVGASLDDVLRISKMLAAPEFSQTLKFEFQMYVIKLLETLFKKSEELKQSPKTIEANMQELELCEEINDELEKNIYIATIKVMALSLSSANDPEKLQAKGNAILEKICQRQEIPLGVLHEKYLAAALTYVDNLDAPLDGLSEPILLLHGLLTICQYRSTYLEQLQSKLLTVWEYCADDAKVKVFSAVSIAMLHWSESICKENDKSTQLLSVFVANVVEPHLQWRAGANAESMRSLATATLCSMSQGAPQEARQILPTIVKYMPSLLEDHAIATRHYAVKCMFNFGELPVDELKTIAYATLQRLDDPSADIRRLAALAIPKFSPKFDSQNDAASNEDHDRQIWDIFIKKAIDMMLLHYEGPEVRLKAAIKDSILLMANIYPDICKDSFNRTIAICCSGAGLMELQKEMPFDN